jgi:hypothetical protein
MRPLTASEALAAADIAREAARLVARPGGWGQCGAGRARATLGDGGCTQVVIWLAADQSWSKYGGRRVLDEARRRLGGDQALFNWNDAPERQQHEVVELLESIAKHFDREATRVREAD